MKTKRTVFILSLVFSTLFCTSIYAQDTITGLVSYHNIPSSPLENVIVQLYDSNGAMYDSCVTGSDGIYTFYNIPNGNYTLNFYTTEPAGGIDLSDAFLIFLNIIGYYSFDPIQFLAADVDNNGVINWTDYWTVVIYYFVHGTPFPCGDWVFEEVTVNVGSGGRSGSGSGGSSGGDVDGSWLPGSTKSSSLPPIAVVYDHDEYLTANQQIDIPLTLTNRNALRGFVYVVDYPADLLQIADVSSAVEGLNYEIFEDQVRISWMDTDKEGGYEFNGTPLITLNAVTSGSFVNDAEIELNIGEESHMLDKSGNKVFNAELQLPRYLGQEISMMIGDLYPNPANSYFSLDYELTTNSDVSIRIFNISGQLIRELRYPNEMPGVNTKAVDLHEFGITPGIYTCLISVNGENNFSNSKLLIVTE